MFLKFQYSGNKLNAYYALQPLIKNTTFICWQRHPELNHTQRFFMNLPRRFLLSNFQRIYPEIIKSVNILQVINNHERSNECLDVYVFRHTSEIK